MKGASPDDDDGGGGGGECFSTICNYLLYQDYTSVMHKQNKMHDINVDNGGLCQDGWGTSVPLTKTVRRSLITVSVMTSV